MSKEIIKILIIILVCLAGPIISAILPQEFTFLVGIITGELLGILIWNGADINE